MLDKGDKKIYNIKDESSNTEDWVECISCGFRGLLEEFLSDDISDTKCPRCGEDVQRFEL